MRKAGTPARFLSLSRFSCSWGTLGTSLGVAGRPTLDLALAKPFGPALEGSQAGAVLREGSTLIHSQFIAAGHNSVVGNYGVERG